MAPYAFIHRGVGLWCFSQVRATQRGMGLLKADVQGMLMPVVLTEVFLTCTLAWPSLPHYCICCGGLLWCTTSMSFQRLPCTRWIVKQEYAIVVTQDCSYWGASWGTLTMPSPCFAFWHVCLQCQNLKNKTHHFWISKEINEVVFRQWSLLKITFIKPTVNIYLIEIFFLVE